MRGLFTAYDDYDSGSPTDYGDRVMISDWTYASPDHSLRINACSDDSAPWDPWKGETKAFATTPYLRDWETGKGYWLNFSFRLNSTDNLRFIVARTVDVFLVVAGSDGNLTDGGSTLWSYVLDGSTEFITNLDSDWHDYEICVSCVNGDPFKEADTYDLTIDIDNYQFTRYSLGQVEPRSVLMGDAGNRSEGMVVLSEDEYSRGEGYWDDIVLDYRTVVEELEIDAGDDQQADEGQVLNFSGRARGTSLVEFYDSTVGGFDRAMNTTSTGQWVTYAEYLDDDLVVANGLLTRNYGQGRAVFAPGDGLAPHTYNKHRGYQIYVNAVRWAANTQSPPENISVLLIWGYWEIIAYHGPATNQYRALMSEGFDVTLRPYIPLNETELDMFDVIVQVSSGWTHSAKHAQQAYCYNENYSSRYPPQDCLQPRLLNETEGELLADYVDRGGGYVASAEVGLGAHLDQVANRMGVDFEGYSGDSWVADVVSGQEEHPILEKWGGTRHDIVEYHWDFGDGNDGYGQTVSHAYGEEDVCTVTLTVTDEANQTANDTLTVTVYNVPPTVTATINSTSVWEGSSFTVNGTIYDPSWNDTMSAVWNFMYKNGLGEWQVQSAVIEDGPGYGNVTRRVRERVWDFGDDGNYTIYLNATDEFGGFDSDTVNITVENVPPVLINVTTILHLNAPRTHGYWKHQCKVRNPNEDHPGIRQDWIDDIRQQSTYFTDIYTKDDACDILKPKNPMTWLKQARMQLLALWFNVVSGLLWIDSPLHHPSAPNDDTVREFIQHAEILLNGNPSSTDLEWIATVAENINADANDEQPDWAYIDPTVGEHLAYAYDVGSDDLTFIWYDHGNDITHDHYNNPPLPEPDYDPVTNEEKTPWGIYPFQVVDVLVVGYGPNEGVGVDVYLRCLKDDDDGISDDAKDCPVPPQNPNPLLAINWSFEFDISYREIFGGFTIAELTAEYTAYDPLVIPRQEGGAFT
jgi:PKD repeat protein